MAQLKKVYGCPGLIFASSILNSRMATSLARATVITGKAKIPDMLSISASKIHAGEGQI